MLLGSVTVGLLRDAAFFVRDAIPGCRLVILEGQGHGAMLDAPDFFANKILEIAWQKNNLPTDAATVRERFPL